MLNDERWRLGFHMMPPGGRGSLNDPNGCCQFKGIYHLYHQYQPLAPKRTYPRAWGHAYSDDLVHWHHTGLSIHEDSPFDCHGSFSGCALIEDGGRTMRLFYTGNFKEPGRHDFTYEGRWAFQITTTTQDGLHFTPKVVLLSPQDYPEWVSCHVRDPKVWVQDNGDGRPYRMLLGGRDRNDQGFILLYDSRDKLHWRLRSTIRPKKYLGYMLECPDRMTFQDETGKMHEFLVFCPQRWKQEVQPWENQHVTGYVPMPGNVLNATSIDGSHFRQWDYGFDFYATQAFVDERGRCIMFAWMGNPDTPYVTQPEGLGFSQCITVARHITMGSDRLLRSYPVAELALLHGEAVTPHQETSRQEPSHEESVLSFPEHRADLCLSQIEGECRVLLDEELELCCARGRATLRFCGDPAVAGGRVEHHCEIEETREIRILVDSSAVEIFVDEGRYAFATRWFPKVDQLTVHVDGVVGDIAAWTMGDGMADVWNATDLADQAIVGFED
jgi:beta-fructofuranosidase